MGGAMIRPARPDDATEWHRLRCQLWPGRDSDHLRDIRAFFDGGTPTLDAVLVAETGSRLVGFAELSIRPYAEGCTSNDVAYLEGWFVSESSRSAGVGGALVQGAESWARGRGCTEFASDTEVANEVGYRAHLACGFEHSGTIHCFRKEL